MDGHVVSPLDLFRTLLVGGGLFGSLFLTRTACHRTTHANGYYGAWPGWAVSISVLPLKVSDSLRLHGLQPTRLLCLWDFPGRNTGVGFHFLLQGIFPTQESNPCLLHWQVDSLPLSHLGSPGVCFFTSVFTLHFLPS